MAYLIDGNNFIGHILPHALRDPESKYILVSKLLIFQKIKKTKVLVAFDGPPDPNLTDSGIHEKSFSIIFPSFDQNADMAIKEIISKQSDLRRFFVVSSDNEIRSYARSKGANALKCEDFNRQLKEALKEYRRLSEANKNVSLPSPLEVNHWMEIFKTKK